VVNRDEQIPGLRRALASKDRHERAQAAVEAGYSDAVELRDELRAQTQDADDLVAVAGIFACWQLGKQIDTEARLDRVVSALSSGEAETVMLAASALGEFGEDTLGPLTKLLEAGSPHAVPILRVLGDIGGPQSLQAVQQAAQSADADVAAAAREVLDEWEE
jgi:HEAT repeat protein